MQTDFSSEEFKNTYAQRSVHPLWLEFMRSVVDATDQVVADIGCGGGIYSQAWRTLGAKRVVGIDSSSPIISSALPSCHNDPGIDLVHARADCTGLPEASVDIVFQRALIHHLSDLHGEFVEAGRILRSDGCLIIQDRTPEDVRLPASRRHIRGYFFERFPELMRVELGRRHSEQKVRQELERVGFSRVSTTHFWEVRRTYDTVEELCDDLAKRVGRSILRQLDDRQLSHLIEDVRTRLAGTEPIVEEDRWTIWTASRDKDYVQL